MRKISRFLVPASVLGVVTLFAIAATVELAMGRKLWGVSGQPGLWSSNVNSEHNSQYIFDPYTLSHITHGILLYGLLWLIARRQPVRIRAVAAVAFECLWEIVENTDIVIRRYRAATISLHYYGDSVMNSMGDVLAAVSGFVLAALLCEQSCGASALRVAALCTNSFHALSSTTRHVHRNG